MRKTVITTILGYLWISPVLADENLFGYVYGADPMPKGGIEFYQWNIWHWDKGAGSYKAFDTKTELEYGVTDRFTVSGLLLGSSEKASNGGIYFEDSHKKYGVDGGGLELTYNFLSTYNNPVGISAKAEYKQTKIAFPKASGEITGTHNRIGELYLIVQKNFMDNQLAWANNFATEFVYERNESNKWDKTLGVNYKTGLSYRFRPNWYIGIETKIDKDFYDFRHADHWDWFGGPTLHFGEKKFWVTATYWRQLRGRTYNVPSEDLYDSSLALVAHEKNEFRLKLGYNF